MRLIMLSDESGDNGLKFKKISWDKLLESQELVYYKVTLGLITTEEYIDRLVDEATKAFHSVFGYPIRKWSRLKSKHKNSPELLEKWFRLWFVRTSNCIRLLGVAIIDKKFYSTSEHIARDSIKSYVYIFKRLLPFLKKLSYEARTNPEIIWYIDTASDRKRFTEPLRREISILADNKNVALNGPYFINKPKHIKDEKLRRISLLINTVDFMAGAINRFLKEYYLHCTPMRCIDCLTSSKENICLNSYINVWRVIHRYINDISVLYGDSEIWKWYGLIYLPPLNRKKEERILGEDPFYK